MYSNQVWTLVDLPANIRPIGCKWVYKKKRGPDGRVETFKVRLIAKGYTQKEDIDYEETFSPVAKLKSIRILSSIAVHLVFEIWQMDVKTAFSQTSILRKTSIWCSQTVLWLTTNSKEFASCRSPFMDWSRHPELRTFVLTRQSGHLIFVKIWMSHECTWKLWEAV